MRRIMTLFLAMTIACCLYAETFDYRFNHTPLSVALARISDEHPNVDINFIYNELEDYRTSARIHTDDLYEAVRQTVGLNPVNVSRKDGSIYVEALQHGKYSYRGTVVGEDGEPVVAGVVLILDPMDSSVVTYGVTDENGSFLIPCDRRNMLAKISYLGYKDNISEVPYDGNMGRIVLRCAAVSLGEVEVKARRPIIERKVDRLVFNVDNAPFAQGNNLMDLLRQTPLVKVTDNSLGIIGKSGVKVMFNGKISYLDGDDLMQYLKSLQSDDIASIEVITTPPSRYDAGGNGGMINIIMKRNPQEGLNGSVGLTYLQRSYAGERVNMALNYRSAKSFVAVKLCQSRNKGHVDEDYDIFRETKTQHSVTDRTDTFDNYGVNLSVEQKVSQSSTLGASYDFGYGKELLDIDNRYEYLSKNKLDSTLVTDSRQKGIIKSHTANIYYDLAIDSTGKKLGFVMNYMHHSPDKKVDFTTRNEQSGETAIVREPNNIAYAICTGEANLELPYSWLNIETGIKYGDITNKSDMQYLTFTGEEYVPYPGRCNRFDYHERTVAGYVSVNRPINEYLSFKAGLRYEHTFVKGVTPGSDVEDVKMDYGKLFPTVYLSYVPNSKNNFNINYTRRINRPYFRAVNPFKWYTNPNNVDEGNPALKPSFSDNFEIGYLYRNSLSILAYYQKEDDAYGQMMYVASDNTTYSTYENVYNNRQFGVNLSYNFNPLYCWNMYVSGNYIYNKSEIKVKGYIPQNGHSFDYRINNTISFDARRRFQLYVNYSQNLPYKVGVTYDRSYANISAGFKASFMDNNLTFNVYGNDIFHQDLVRRRKVSTSAVQIYSNYYDSRYFLLSVVYKWGNNRLKENKKKINFTEKNRI